MRDSIFWAVTVPRIMSTYAAIIFVLLWVGFIAAMGVNREWLDMLWNWVQGVPKTIAWGFLSSLWQGYGSGNPPGQFLDAWQGLSGYLRGQYSPFPVYIKLSVKYV
jgi:hypothetical protein